MAAEIPRRPLAVAWLTGALVMVGTIGCTSPADVESHHRDQLHGLDAARAAEEIHYRESLAEAQEWNSHVWGIPASGWVAILMVASVVAAILLGYLGWLWHQHSLARLRDRATAREQRHQVDLAHARRPTCPMCGHQPAVPERAP